MERTAKDLMKFRKAELQAMAHEQGMPNDIIEDESTTKKVLVNWILDNPVKTPQQPIPKGTELEPQNFKNGATLRKINGGWFIKKSDTRLFVTENKTAFDISGPGGIVEKSLSSEKVINFIKKL